jgi:hypothetical protein
MTTMTEEEATEKWCPFARVFRGGGDGSAAINRHRNGDLPAGTNCIGHRCMAWRRGDLGGDTAGYCGMVPS